MRDLTDWTFSGPAGGEICLAMSPAMRSALRECEAQGLVRVDAVRGLVEVTDAQTWHDLLDALMKGRVQ